MDTLTHALSGALAARATAPRPGTPDTIPLSRRVGLGFLAAAAPDLDIVISWVSPLSYLYYHRGVTHSFVMLPLWALLLAFLSALVWRKGPSWRAYFGVFAWGIGSHIAGDLLTSFGTMIFAPLSDARYALSTTFIIDLWFTGIILAGLIAAAVWRRSRVPVIAGLAVLAGYVTLQYALQQRALDFGVAYAQAQNLKSAQVAAQPRPVSPFNWMVLVDEGDRYRYSLVNLWRNDPARLAPDAGFIARLSAPYLPARPGDMERGTALRDRIGGCSDGAGSVGAAAARLLPLVRGVSGALQGGARQSRTLRLVPGSTLLYARPRHVAIPLWFVPRRGWAVGAVRASGRGAVPCLLRQAAPSVAPVHA